MNKSVTISLNFSLIMGSERTWAILDLHPPCRLFAELASIAFAGNADNVATFICPYFLAFYLFAAYPAKKIFLNLF